MIIPFEPHSITSSDIKYSVDIPQIQRDIGRIEKWVLRNAFDDEKKPYLPKHILYRQKEQFSDGVGYSWIDGLKDHANKRVTDSMLTNANFVYPENTPATKEAYYYRTIFEMFFPKTVDEIYKVASISLRPNISGQIFMGVMVSPLKPGDISYERFVRESKGILESLRKRAQIMTDGFNSCKNVVCNFTEGARYSFPQIQLPPKAIEAAKIAAKDRLMLLNELYLYVFQYVFNKYEVYCSHS